MLLEGRNLDAIDLLGSMQTRKNRRISSGEIVPTFSHGHSTWAEPARVSDYYPHPSTILQGGLVLASPLYTAVKRICCSHKVWMARIFNEW